MILGTIDNPDKNLTGPIWNQVFTFLKKLSPIMEETIYEIKGDDIYATIFSKTTHRPQESIIETHRKYVDIHAAISGSETIAWFRSAGLKVKTPYAPEKDAEFYETDVKAAALMTMTPGNFVVFFPEDPHMPQLVAGNGPETIKKVVIKVAVGLL